MLRPLQPLVEYAINYDYISKVLCINKDKPELSCNGKCQLMKRIEKQQQEDFNSLRINMEKYPIGFVEVLYLPENKIFKNLKSNKLFYYKFNYHFSFHQEIFHPPTV